MRIARIAMDARVSTALVHYHFATREALLAEALEHSFEPAGEVSDREGDPVKGSLMVDRACRCPASRSATGCCGWSCGCAPSATPSSARRQRSSTRGCTTGSGRRSRRATPARVDAGAIADRLLALIDGYGVRALLGDPAMPLERAREEIWASTRGPWPPPQ